jgi:seryl-tRNA synthetase
MAQKIATIEESLYYMSDSIAEGLNSFTSTNTIQKSINGLSEDIYTAVDNNTEAINKLTAEVSSLKHSLAEIQDELTNLQELSDIKYSLELIANTLYNHYNKK